MNRHTSPAEPVASQPAGAGIASIAEIAGIAGIELVLRQIIQAVSDGQDNRIEPLVDQLGTLFESLGPADKAGPATPQDLQRVMDLWKQTSLSLASASHETSTELQRIAAGRKTLRAYRS